MHCIAVSCEIGLYLVFFDLSASETGLLLVVKLGRNVVMMRAGVKIMRDARKTTD